MIPHRDRRHPLFWFVLAGAVAGFLELGSFLAIVALNRVVVEPIERRAPVLQRQRAGIDLLLAGQGSLQLALDPELGWVYRSGFHGDRDGITGQGVRGDRVYEGEPGDALRVAAFGDSFVYGNEVSNVETWGHAVERIAPAVELLNYGIGGYGMDQAYLRYLREGTDLFPDVVLFAFTPVNLGRLVNVYRRFVSSSEIPLVKPRFRMSDGGELLRVPVPIVDAAGFRRLRDDVEVLRRLGEDDWWYRPEVWENPAHDLSATVRLLSALWTRVDRRYVDADRPISGRDGPFRPQSEAFRIQVALIDSVAARVRADGALPFILLLPDRGVLGARMAGGRASWDPLLEALRRSDVPFFDGTEAFLRAPSGMEGLSSWFAPGNHYSAEGNRILGEWMAGVLLREASAACLAGLLRPGACSSVRGLTPPGTSRRSG